MGARDSVLVGTAGEHYVLYEILRRNLLASLSPPNAYAADILVFSPSMSVGSMVQVKTRTTGRDKGWHMSVKHETLIHPRLFYAFLDLQPEHPEVYLMPSKVAADVVKRKHAAWLATPGKDGRQHKDTTFRRIQPTYRHEVPGLAADWLDEWRDRWDLLMADPEQ